MCHNFSFTISKSFHLTFQTKYRVQSNICWCCFLFLVCTIWGSTAILLQTCRDVMANMLTKSTRLLLLSQLSSTFIRFCFGQPFVFDIGGQEIKQFSSITSLTSPLILVSMSTKSSSFKTNNYFPFSDASQLQRDNRYICGIWWQSLWRNVLSMWRQSIPQLQLVISPSHKTVFLTSFVFVILQHKFTIIFLKHGI